MQSKATSIEDYIASLPAKERAVIDTLDKLVRSALVGVVGSMKYGMPTYETSGRFVALNAQKNYFSFYADPAIVKLYRKELKGLDVGKSCIRFRKLEDISLETLRKIMAAYSK